MTRTSSDGVDALGRLRAAREAEASAAVAEALARRDEARRRLERALKALGSPPSGVSAPPERAMPAAWVLAARRATERVEAAAEAGRHRVRHALGALRRAELALEVARAELARAVGGRVAVDRHRAKVALREARVEERREEERREEAARGRFFEGA